MAAQLTMTYIGEHVLTISKGGGTSSHWFGDEYYGAYVFTWVKTMCRECGGYPRALGHAIEPMRHCIPWGK